MGPTDEEDKSGESDEGTFTEPLFCPDAPYEVEVETDITTDQILSFTWRSTTEGMLMRMNCTFSITFFLVFPGQFQFSARWPGSLKLT